MPGPSPALSGLSGLSGMVGGAVSAILAAPTLAQMGVAQSKELDADGIGWAAASPLVVDEFGKMILWVEYLNNGDSTRYHVPLVSNDSGATWALPTLAGFNSNTLGDIVNIHGADCYEPGASRMHRLIVLTQADGGVYYRQYSLTRDGSSNITTITRTRQMQVEAGVGGMSFESPIVRWHALSGKLILAYSALNGASAGSKAEIRATCIVPLGTNADTTTTNWLPPMNENAGAGSTDSIDSAGLVKYSCLAKSNVNSQPFLSLDVLASGDLVLGWAAPAATPAWVYDRLQYASGTTDWRTGLASGASPPTDAGKTNLLTLVRSGTDTGYTLKKQIASKWAQASATRVGISVPNWASNALGDTVTLVVVDPTTDTVVGTAEVYSAAGAHSYAPTCDLGWDTIAQQFVATYVKTSSQNSFFKTYTAGAGAGQGESALHAVFVDLPYVHGSRVGGKTFFYDRDTASRVLPDKYYGYSGSGAWS